MTEEMVNSNDLSIDHHLSRDEITNPIEAQLLEFCESDLFSPEIQNTETTSSNEHNNNYCYEGETSYHPGMTNYEINPPPPPTATSPSAAQNVNFSIIFDDPGEDQLEHDIAASINFSPSPSFSAPHPQYYNNNNNITTTNNSNNNNNNDNNSNNNNNNQEPFNHLSLGDHHIMHQYSTNERWPMVPAPPPPPLVPVMGPPPPLPSVPSYIRLRSSQPACSLMESMMPPPFLPPFSADNSGIFSGNGGLMIGNDLSHQELDFQGDSVGLFMPDNLSRIFNCSSELQTLSSESQHLVHGGTSASLLTSEISSLDDPTFKVGKLSVEERKRKIHRYLQKRNERNFSKKIKYACRKTLADSRPRVRGRFAKNDELGEIGRTAGSNHEDEIDDDVNLFSSSIPNHQRKVVVKEEDELESADIFAHISGVNSLKCNYPIQSWI